MSGIYRIRNLRNQKSYIGQAAKTFDKRFNVHRHHLRQGTHHSKHLQRAWDLYGEQAFAFEIIEKIPRGQMSEEKFKTTLSEREQFHIDAFQSTDRSFGYNISPSAGSQLGYRHSNESKRKMSAAGRGRKLPKEQRQRIADSMKAKGIKRSRAERDKLSARRARLRRNEVFDVLDMYEEGIAQEEIAERFGVSVTGISRIVRGRSYRKVGEEWRQTTGVETLPTRRRANVMFAKHEVFDILDRDYAGETRSSLAKAHDASPGNITFICQGKYYNNWFLEWCRLTGTNPSHGGNKKARKLSERDVSNIRNDLVSGIKQRDIARKYGVSAPTICDIKKGRIHKQTTGNVAARKFQHKVGSDRAENS